MILSTSPGFLRQNFISQNYTIRDTSLTSPNYFDITFFPDQIGGGVSLIKLRGNPDNLAFDKSTQVEILDAQGTPVRHEVATHIDRFQNYYISIYVYDTVAPGIGSVSIVGVAKREPRGEIVIDQNAVNDLGHNLIWTRPITILPNARNNSELVFDDPPFVSVAQVVAPARVAYNANLDTQFSAITASNLTITTSKFKGFDKKRGSNFTTNNGIVKIANKDKIADNKAKSTNINTTNQARTVNYVETPTRIEDRDTIGGFILNEDTRYNTVLIASSSFFSSSYLGGAVEFLTNPQNLSPGVPAGYEPSNTDPYDGLVQSVGTQSISQQLERWSANIVRIKDDRTAFIDQPVQANIRRSSLSNSSRGYETKHTFYNVTGFTASIIYTPDSLLYTTSSEVSQSYLQFTIQDLNPIGGLVDKVRVYYRRGSEVGDWELLQDQYVTPVEFLTDARYPNQTSYGLDVSDYYLLGHFTEQSIIDDNWSSYVEQANSFDTTTTPRNNSVLSDSARLECSTNVSKVLTTRYYQNYAEDSVYTLSFNCILGPYTQLELYGNSSTLQTTVFGSDPFPRAFDKTLNYQILTYTDQYNRYGKLVGKITNNTPTTRDYTRVVFDFKTDKEGLGRPLFRVIQTNSPTSATAYISQISVTPVQLTGFTPKTLQFAFPAKLDTNIDLNETVDYKLEYYDYTGNQSEYVTYLEDVRMELQTEIPTTACQAEQTAFDFTPQYWISCSAADGAIDGMTTAAGMFSGSYTSNTKWYPAFVNKFVLNGYLGQANATASGLTPVDGWNASIPINTITPSGIITDPKFRYISASEDGAYRNANGLVTSSWHYVDSFTANLFDGAFTNNLATVIYYSFTSKSLSPIDNIPIITSMSCVGITRQGVQSAYGEFNNATTNAEKTAALKRRRLFWPNGTSATASFFTENGGIYNVKFKLKKYIPSSHTTTRQYEPDSNTYMSVFIHNVNATFTTSASYANGWYPPPQNIVKIGNSYSVGGVATPAISYFDSATGYYYDEYNINLVQYGTPAQLVFEPSGDTTAGIYFGTLVDDIQICKIGVTTDPYYIKPQTIANNSVRLGIGELPTYDAERTDR